MAGHNLPFSVSDPDVLTHVYRAIAGQCWRCHGIHHLLPGAVAPLQEGVALRDKVRRNESPQGHYASRLQAGTSAWWPESLTYSHTLPLLTHTAAVALRKPQARAPGAGTPHRPAGSTVAAAPQWARWRIRHCAHGAGRSVRQKGRRSPAQRGTIRGGMLVYEQPAPAQVVGKCGPRCSRPCWPW
jgi:hypothetical protein